MIKVENVSKVYPLRQSRIDEDGNNIDKHWALKDISFEIKKGESVGIIGPNGSGKSTLLKILAGVTKPSSGSVTIRGKIASILDIGAGFHPELSGRENVFLNGQIHGFSKNQIKSTFDEILLFSGIEKFIDEPVKNYSNGMYLRLAFSIMVHLDFDVYLFDEVFSVGDAAFALKTKKKFRELNASDKTIVFVSHNINELMYQDQYILIENGKVKENTNKRSSLVKYLENSLITQEIIVDNSAINITTFPDVPFSPEVKILNFKLYQEGLTEIFRTDEPFSIELKYEKLKNTDTLDVLLTIDDIEGNPILTSAPFIKKDFSTDQSSGFYTCKCIIPAYFFNSQVYECNFLFFKNVGSFFQKHVDLNVQNLLKSDTIDIALNLKNLIKFKPSIKRGELKIDLGNLNIQSKLIPGFEWEVVKCNG